MKVEHITVKLSREMREAVNKKCEEDGVPLAYLIRGFLRRYLEGEVKMEVVNLGDYGKLRL